MSHISIVVSWVPSCLWACVTSENNNVSINDVICRNGTLKEAGASSMEGTVVVLGLWPLSFNK